MITFLLIVTILQSGITADSSHIRSLCRDSQSLDSTMQRLAWKELETLEPEVIPIIIKLSKDEELNVRCGAILALSLPNFKDSLIIVFSTLLDLLNGKDKVSKEYAIGSLSEIVDSTFTSIVVPLTTILKDTAFIHSNVFGAYWGAVALGKIGPPAKIAIPTLRKIMQDRKMGIAVHAEAVKAIQLIQRQKGAP